MRAGRRVLAGLLLALCAIAWFGTPGLRPLYKPDEARYGEIAREMAQSGDWVTPRLNGYKYFEKPPLQYWATAAAFGVFGAHDWSARLWTALTAAGGIALVFFTAGRLFGPTAGVLSAAVLAGSPLYLMMGQVTTLDMGVSFFLSVAIFGFALAQRDAAAERERRGLMLLFWAACALAVLSKGLIGVVLPLGSVALYALVCRDWRLLRRLHPAAGVALFLTIVCPWFVRVSMDNGEFLHFFFVQEHWQRFTTPMHHRVHPAWYFIPVLVAGMAPWILAAAAGWAASLAPRPGEGFRPRLFLGLWALVVLAFFSASSSKLPPYILPMLPALAVLAAGFLASGQRRGLMVAQAVLLLGVGIALGAGIPRLVSAGGPLLDELGVAYVPWLAAAAAVLGAAGGLAALCGALRRSVAAAGCITLGVLAATLLAIAGHRTLAPSFSVAHTVALLPAPIPDRAAVFAVNAYDHTMPWSLRRTVTMVGNKDELEKAIVWEPDKFIADLAGFAHAWKAAPDAYAFFTVRDFEQLRGELGLPMQLVARGPRYLIVRKP